MDKRAYALAAVIALGAVGALSAAPNPAAADMVVASDSFARTTSEGWGAADLGGTYATNADEHFSVAGGTGAIAMAPGRERLATLPATVADADLAVSFRVSALPAAGASIYLALEARRQLTKDAYRPRLRVMAGGTTDLELTRVDGATGAVTQLRAAVRMPFTVAAGSWYRLRASVTGNDKPAVAASAWAPTDPQPSAWQSAATDDEPERIASGGKVGLWGYLSASGNAASVAVDELAVTSSVSPSPSPSATPSPAPLPPRGARLPVNYSIDALSGTRRFVAPTGSDTSGTGAVTAPYRTLPKAVAASSPGDSIVLRGGTYPIASNQVLIQDSRLTITAYPGETPVFDGSVAAPQSAGQEGDLRSITYQPMPAAIGEGLSLSSLPVATFASGKATGQAAQVGWRCVTGSSAYTTPAPTTQDADGCTGTARVVTAYWPDQAWVDDRALLQVSDKARVVAGTFWVARSSSTDANPPSTKMYLHKDDAAALSKLRVSASSGPFLEILGDGVTLRGFQIKRHSPSWSRYSVSVLTGVNDFAMQDIAFDDNAGISFKVGGGDDAGGAQIIRRAQVDRVTLTDAGWMGAALSYSNDLQLRDSSFQRINANREFNRGPMSGAIKATKTYRTVVENTEFRSVWGHALWWDQSNYDTTIARSDISDVSHSAVLMEISHGLNLIDNVIRGPAAPTGEEGHTTVRLAGSSGLRLINNTITGGPVGIGIYTDGRSKTYGSSGRPCSEHAVRYGQSGDAKADCNVGYSSDFDKARAGAFSPSGATNLTPGMNWKPAVDLMQNNVIANQTDPLPNGWATPCGGHTPLCVFGYVGSPAVTVGLNTIFRRGMSMNGNIYQPTGSDIAQFRSRSGTVSEGAFVADDIDALRGSSGLGGTTYGLSVESLGRSGTGWVNGDGSATSLLRASHGQAAPVPTDRAINIYLPAGARHFGAFR